MTSHRPLVLSGASGVGKGTIVDHLTMPKKSIFQSTVSCTTRKRRTEEVHGQHYYFINQSQFDEKIDLGLFMEYKEVHGNLYGTLFSEFERLEYCGLAPVVEIDVKGALALTQIISHACFIFLSPPSPQILEHRLKGRGTDSETDIQKRLSNAEHERHMAKVPPFIHIVNGECIFQTTADIVNHWRAQ